MKLSGKERLYDFKKMHPDAKSQIESWVSEVEDVQWKTPHDLKQRYPNASLLGNQEAVFNICGNKYRLLVKISYKSGIVLLIRAGTHKEYDNW